jgi:hypothetical protein
MAICGCGLPASCCQPAVAGGIIYADLWGELSTHLAWQALFTQEFCAQATATSFHLSKHTGGGDTAPAFSGLHVYLLFTWEVGLPPLSCGVFLLLPLSQAFPLLVAGCMPLFQPSPARSSSFIYSSGRDSPPPCSALRVPHPLCYVSLLFLLLITQFLFFPQVGVGLSRGLC